jgi:DnaJ-class molecular chaperone
MSRARDRLKRIKRRLWALALAEKLRPTIRWKKCDTCNGTGMVAEVPSTRFGGLFTVPVQPRRCRSCFGGGKVVDQNHHVYMGIETITGSER